jgi:16S rRNA (adenine1518-N6/adenine1519-N6)-dimethyltransferase
MDFRAKKRFGQNFLQDRNIAANIVGAAKIQAGDYVWEIGPGKGVLTSRIVEHGCKPVCFEIDRDLIAYLTEKYGDKIDLIPKDVLRYDWQSLLSGYADQSRKVKLIANIPYNITSPLLYKLSRFSDHFSLIVIMIQKEVADRLIAPPGQKSYGVLSLKVRHNFEVRKLFNVPAHLFIPQPKVESTVIALSPRTDRFIPSNHDLYWQIIESAFHNRRKMLRNNLLAVCSREEMTILMKLITEAKTSPDQSPVSKFLENEFIHFFDLTLRGESLSEKDYINLYHLIGYIRSNFSSE